MIKTTIASTGRDPAHTSPCRSPRQPGHTRARQRDRLLRHPSTLGLIVLVGSAHLASSETTGTAGDLRALGQCSGCVIENRDYTLHRLTSIDLSDARLSVVVFDGAQMSLAIFENADLARVSFAGADLSGAIFVGARLSEVSFEGANLRGAVFEGATMDRTTFEGAHLCNTQTPADEMDNSDCERAWQTPAGRSDKSGGGPRNSGK